MSVSRGKEMDKHFFWTLVILVTGGFFIFVSASLGLHARSGATFSEILFNQAFFGLFLGTIALFVTSNIHYKVWHRYSFYIFIASLILTFMVFVPGVGFEHGGARRWINLGFTSIQPAEILKFGVLMYIAALLAAIGPKIKTIRYGLMPFMGILGIVSIVLLLQPDTGTVMVIGAAATAMYFVAGGPLLHFVFLMLPAILGSIGLIIMRPYLLSRIMIFFDPSADPLGAGYQIQQSLLAVGSGGMFGRGLGQSIQKFNFLPEPIGDSIFAVFAEEWGFVGSFVLISLFLFFATRGLKIASQAPNTYSRLLTVGIIVALVSQAFINMATMIGLFPLSGMPLIFVSHGGTALLTSLAATGIVLNISKYQQT
jgi:cell division protein FtsW